MAPRQLVVIESPFAGDISLHVHYADCLLLDSLQRGESPFLGHLLYPRVFDDHQPLERDAGIQAHLAVIARADLVVLGMDLGKVSAGMQAACEVAYTLGKPIERRYLGEHWARDYRPRPTSAFSVFPYGLKRL